VFAVPVPSEVVDETTYGNPAFPDELCDSSSFPSLLLDLDAMEDAGADATDEEGCDCKTILRGGTLGPLPLFPEPALPSVDTTLLESASDDSSTLVFSPDASVLLEADFPSSG